MESTNKQIVGNLIGKNISIVGLNQNKREFIDGQQFKDYYYLSFSKLEELGIDENKILDELNLKQMKQHSSKQNIIIANILELVKKGIRNIILDDLLTYIDIDLKKIVVSYLKNNQVNFINITSDMEDTLFTDYLIVLHENMVAIEGETLNVLLEERLLKRLGFNLPFMVDLSIQLKYYGLVDKIYLNQEDLVNELWK